MEEAVAFSIRCHEKCNNFTDAASSFSNEMIAHPCAKVDLRKAPTPAYHKARFQGLAMTAVSPVYLFCCRKQHV
jgi:hypothetical protein